MAASHLLAVILDTTFFSYQIIYRTSAQPIGPEGFAPVQGHAEAEAQAGQGL